MIYVIWSDLEWAYDGNQIFAPKVVAALSIIYEPRESQRLSPLDESGVVSWKQARIIYSSTKMLHIGFSIEQKSSYMPWSEQRNPFC